MVDKPLIRPYFWGGYVRGGGWPDMTYDTVLLMVQKSCDHYHQLRKRSFIPLLTGIFHTSQVVFLGVSETINSMTKHQRLDLALHMGVSENSGTPKSSTLIGFSIINHPFWGTPIFLKHPYIRAVWSSITSPPPKTSKDARRSASLRPTEAKRRYVTDRIFCRF